MKERLIRKYGTLRRCAVETKINYYRLSNIVNGYIRPKDTEMKLLGITQVELKETLKV
jgi:hypothetical protein